MKLKKFDVSSSSKLTNKSQTSDKAKLGYSRNNESEYLIGVDSLRNHRSKKNKLQNRVFEILRNIVKD